MTLFDDRVAIVTGGSRGIGRAIAHRLASGGADVAVGFFRDRDRAERTADEIRALGRRAVAVKGHVGDPEKAAAIVETAAEELGPPSILISNAASGVLRPLGDSGVREWGWAMDVNARALLVLANAVRPWMDKAGGGAIVALSSLGSSRVLPHYGTVGVSKAALEALIRYLAVEFASAGIQVNGVSAGVVDTDALSHFPQREEMLADARRRTPAGRILAPEDVATLVHFLCSPDASMIRGQILTIDGGYSLIA